MRFAALLPLMLFLSACGGQGEPNKADEASSAINLTGQQIFQRCSACHTIGKGETHGIGPNLYSIVGRPVASTDFVYSPAIEAVDGVWEESRLNAYLRDPRIFAPGTKMTFAGIKDDGERKLLIDYLKTLK